MTEPEQAGELFADFTEGAVAPATVYIVHGRYEEVRDLDGSMVEIERAYAEPRVAFDLADKERGNVLVAAGDTVSAEAAALMAG